MADHLLEVDQLSKKFCRRLKRSLYYGITDVARQAVGKPISTTLRPEEFWAVNEVSFKVAPGEVIAVVGANGSGKTTLMRIIAGIYHPTKGKVLYPKPLKVTPIFALNVGLRNEFTGLENIKLKAAIFGMTEAELKRKLDFIIDFSELEYALATPVGNYSSGMRARLSYSVAIATEPDLFIIDEALAVGDSLFKTKCYEHLGEYVQEKERAVLYVTNRIRKVMALANRVLVMRGGRLLQDSRNTTEALEYYINDIVGDKMTDDLKELKLKKIRHFEM
ncbi:ATP-binding cassette domain-containing protein [Phaeodactylibacter sp.]|uniref:ABC transporter ATP-binding protein n=1 Tax=Phaeodactylibacter sp. TaxID=1940289 RepID=UPI0025CBAD7B|nr:ATP-binding cassette domain-containing protein [Phaeodactylibacter sp.]MCI5092358.1 ATP-binding cassette domain-containing protein [Phaeodactylibacter sp.]